MLLSILYLLPFSSCAKKNNIVKGRKFTHDPLPSNHMMVVIYPRKNFCWNLFFIEQSKRFLLRVKIWFFWKKKFLDFFMCVLKQYFFHLKKLYEKLWTNDAHYRMEKWKPISYEKKNIFPSLRTHNFRLQHTYWPKFDPKIKSGAWEKKLKMAVSMLKSHHR